MDFDVVFLFQKKRKVPVLAISSHWRQYTAFAAEDNELLRRKCVNT